MGRIVREDYYFEEPGEQNTDDVVEAVMRRVDQTGIKNVLVASDSGKTALKFAEALREKAKVYCVCQGPILREWNIPWPTIKPEYRKRLEELDAMILNRVPFFFHNSIYTGAKWDEMSPEKLVKETLYLFGQGLKVAIEVVLIATMCGYLDPFQEVIGVGGSSRGADTAVVVRATYPTAIFSKDPQKKLEIREIIAMPRVKRW